MDSENRPRLQAYYARRNAEDIPEDVPLTNEIEELPGECGEDAEAGEEENAGEAEVGGEEGANEGQDAVEVCEEQSVQPVSPDDAIAESEEPREEQSEEKEVEVESDNITATKPLSGDNSTMKRATGGKDQVFPYMWSFQPKTFYKTPHPYEMTRFYVPPNPTDTKTGGAPWFGYRQQRWKNHWLPEHKETITQPEPTLDEIRHILTEKFGTLTVAFDHLDFIKNGRISALEWAQGLFNVLYGSSGSHLRPSQNPLRYQLSKIPRWMFDEQMKKLFLEMDVDRDGEISYNEFAFAQGQPVDSSHEFSSKRHIAKDATKAIIPTSRPTSSVKSDTSGELKRREDSAKQETPVAGDEQHDFSAHLLLKFPDVKTAFRNFDLNKNGTLSAIEFIDGARCIGFSGDANKVFHLLDKNKDGQITVMEFEKLIRPTKDVLDRVRLSLDEKEKENKMTKYGPRIKRPPMKRGMSLPGLDVRFPLGEHMASCAGFTTFAREPTRRNQLDFHPTEYPGQDAFNFESTRGPGTYDLPQETGSIRHVSKISCSKLGINAFHARVPRFSAPIPTKEGREELKNLANAYCSFKETAPNCGDRLSQVGQVVNKVVRWS